MNTTPIRAAALVLAAASAAACSSAAPAPAAAPATSAAAASSAAPTAPAPSAAHTPGRCRITVHGATAANPSGLSAMLGDVTGTVDVLCDATTPRTAYTVTLVPVRNGVAVASAANGFTPLGGPHPVPLSANALCAAGKWEYRTTITVDGVAQPPVDGPVRSFKASDCTS